MSSVRTFTCDECGNQEIQLGVTPLNPDYPRSPWIELRQCIAGDGRGIGSHFCSWYCLSVWSEDRYIEWMRPAKETA